MKAPRRFSYLVNEFQLQVLSAYLVYFVVLVFVCSLLIFGPILQLLDSFADYSEAKYLVAKIFLLYHRTIWPGLGGVLLLIVLHWIMISHRIAGPMVRFRRVFEQAASGKLPSTVKLRKHDFFQLEAQHLQKMFDVLRANLTEMQSLAATCRSAIREAQSAAQSGEARSSVESMVMALATLDEIDRLLGATGAPAAAAPLTGVTPEARIAEPAH